MGKNSIQSDSFFIITVWLIYSFYHVSRQGKHLYGKLYRVNAGRNTSAFIMFAAKPSAELLHCNMSSQHPCRKENEKDAFSTIF